MKKIVTVYLFLIVGLFYASAFAQEDTFEFIAPDGIPEIQDDNEISPWMVDNREQTAFYQERMERRRDATERGLCDLPRPEQPVICSQEYSVGATVVPRMAAPYQVQLVTTKIKDTDESLRRNTNNRGRAMWEMRHACGGSLIAKNWVLTAAHCFEKHPDPDPKKHAVRLDVGNISESSSEPVKIKAIYQHEDFKFKTVNNDIALVQLDSSDINLIIKPFSEFASRGGNKIQHAGLALNGTRFWTIGLNKGFSLWNLQTGRLLADQKFQSVAENIEDKHIKSNAFLLWSGDTASLLDLNNGNVVAGFRHGNQIDSAVFSKDGRSIYTWGGPVGLRKWDARTGRPLGHYLRGVTLQDVKILSDSRIIETRYGQGTRIWDLTTNREIGHFSGSDLHNTHRILTQSDRVLFRTPDKLQLVDLRTGKLFPDLVPDEASWFYRVYEKGEIALTFTDQYVTVWDLKTAKRVNRWRAGDEITNVEYEPNSHRVLTSEKNVGTKIWNAGSGNLVTTFPGPEKSGPQFFGKGRRLLSWSNKGVSEVWNTSNGSRLYNINHSLPIENARVSKDEKFILSHSGFGTAEIWDARSGKEIVRVFQGGHVSGMKLYNRGQTLLTWGGNGQARVWDVRSGKEISRVVDTSSPDIRVHNPASRNSIPSLVSFIPLSRYENEVQRAKIVTSFGWGKTRAVDTYEPSAVLRMLALEPIDLDRCAVLGPWNRTNLNDKIFCAYHGQRKTCFGDSGGPVVANGRLVGVISWGSGKCATDNAPGIYSKVASHMPWILEKACGNHIRRSERPEFCPPR